MRKYNAIKNTVNFGKSQKRRDAETRDLIEYLDRQKEKRMSKEIKPVSEMQLITPKRNTKWLEKGFLYEVVSEVNNFGYFKIREPRALGGVVRFIHKNNMKKVKVI